MKHRETVCWAPGGAGNMEGGKVLTNSDVDVDVDVSTCVKRSDNKEGRSECAGGCTVLHPGPTVLATTPPAPHPMFTNVWNDTSHLMKWPVGA